MCLYLLFIVWFSCKSTVFFSFIHELFNEKTAKDLGVATEAILDRCLDNGSKVGGREFRGERERERERK